jgi:NagD protein
MIGDTMETDILGGVQLGFHTVLVLSGGTRQEDLQRYAYRPEVVVDSLAEFSVMLEQTEWRPPWLLPQEHLALARESSSWQPALTSKP